MDLEKLKAPFPANKISWRVGPTTSDKTKGIALAYIDARDVMERLDAVCGPENWQRKHPHANGKTTCAIGIKIDGEWVWKEDGSGDTEREAEKGALSDSFKRSGANWGIGRYLYDMVNMWVDIEKSGNSYKIKDDQYAKLDKAHEALVRGYPESTPVMKPFTDEEANLLTGRIRKAIDQAALNEEKALARAAWPRMSKSQQDLIKAEIDKRSAFFAQAPLPQAAE